VGFSLRERERELLENENAQQRFYDLKITSKMTALNKKLQP
jgi:hypothetical protein